MKRSALDLAKDLVRYSRMLPHKAYSAVYDEWPPEIARRVDKVFWCEIKLRTEAEIVADIRALQLKAAQATARVEREKLKLEAQAARQRRRRRS